jgi:hypothetical protein
MAVMTIVIPVIALAAIVVVVPLTAIIIVVALIVVTVVKIKEFIALIDANLSQEI